jgi:pseudouridine-5'-monophosphatase
LLGVEYAGIERADQTLKSIEDFVPEEWGLPPYDHA